MKWLLMRHAPLIVRPRLDMAMVRWTLAMLRNCTHDRYALNKSRMVRLAEYSRDQLDLLRRDGLQSHTILLVGGGSKSSLWRQIVADIMDTRVICAEQSEAAALGAAIQAAWCTGAGTLEQLCQRCVRLDHASETRPDANNVAAYEQSYVRYRLQVAALSE